MLSPRLVHSGNMQHSPKQPEMRDAPCKAARASGHVLQPSSCLQIAALLLCSGHGSDFSVLKI